MDYLRFLGFTVLAVLLIGLEIWFAGAGGGALAAAAVTVGCFARYCSRRHAIAYLLWLVLLIGWVVLLGRAVKAMIAQHPDQATRLHASEGLLLLLAMIVLHPLCYGIARLALGAFAAIAARRKAA